MKIFFSTIPYFWKMLKKVGIRNVLFSYYYIKKLLGKNRIEEFFKDVRKNVDELFLDSGAFSIQVGTLEPNYDEFVEGYIKFLKKYGHYFDYYAEVDVDKKVGWKKVQEYTEAMRAEGLKPVEVWHANRKLEGWKKMVKRAEKMVAIGGVASNDWFGVEKDTLVKRVNFLSRIARKEGKKVHLFGFTSLKYLKYMNIYSADSTAWLGGGMYGKMFIFERGELKAKKIKSFKKLSHYKANIWNLYQWKKFIDYFEKVKRW